MAIGTKPAILVLLFVAVLCSGCALAPYRPLPLGAGGSAFLPLAKGEPQIERGRPVGWVDGLGHYFFSLPSKLLLLNWKVENHRISLGTEAAIQEYLAVNNMRNVKVRLNQYAPGGEWRRLVKNQGMPAGWRYTLGVVTCVWYTIFPGRVFGGDHYNPYTNTISIYSDLKPVVLHEGAHAKDFKRRRRGFRGWYSLLGALPLVTLYQEAIASGDAIAYTQYTRRTRDERESYKVLYPAYGSYLGSTGATFADPVWWAQYAAVYGTAWTMNIVGRIKAAFVHGPSAPPAKIGSPTPILMPEKNRTEEAKPKLGGPAPFPKLGEPKELPKLGTPQKIPDDKKKQSK